MTVANWKLMADGITPDYEVDLYDYNDDGTIEELEWIWAQISKNDFDRLLVSPARVIPNADLTTAGWSTAMIEFYDSDADTNVDWEEWCIAKKRLNSYYALVGVGGSFANDDYNNQY